MATSGSRRMRGVKLRADFATNVGEIADIPDLDGDGPHDDEERLAKGLGGVLLGGAGGGERAGVMETPNLDDIPNLEEEDLEEGNDEAMAAAPKVWCQLYLLLGWLMLGMFVGFAGNQEER